MTPMPMFSTVMLAVAFGMFWVLAVMVAAPAPTPVTVTDMLVTPVAKFTVCGTVATDVLLELRLTIRPPAGGTCDRFSVNVCVPVPLMVALEGENVMKRSVTSTVDTAGVKPNEVTVMVSCAPFVIPLMVGTTVGAVLPSRMPMLVGEIDTFDGLLLVSVRRIPPGPAGVPNVTG